MGRQFLAIARFSNVVATRRSGTGFHDRTGRPRLHAGDLPGWFERLLRGCIEVAQDTSNEAGKEAERRAYDAAYVETYAKALPALLAKALDQNAASAR